MSPGRLQPQVAARFAAFVGQEVVAWTIRGETRGRLEAVHPVGRHYFLELRAAGRPRLVNTSQLFELELA